MINVTKTFLPPIEEYQHYLRQIWDSSWVTNNGPLVRKLEERLKEVSGTGYFLFASNGTVVLQLALKALGITGEVITTPFSYVATTNAILWENARPVFADIRESDCNIDPEKIEAQITPRTQAILATHVYGIPCDVEAIDDIARRHNLKVIYDAAHAFGTLYKNRPLMSFGDISTTSFHATKLFHTIEGGGLATSDPELADKLSLQRSFGHRKDDYFTVGINGKNSEFHAAMGLCLIDRVPEFIRKRKRLVELYDRLLADAPVKRPQIPPGTSYNYSYYPVIFGQEEVLLQVRSALESADIIPRRYFYPSLNTLPYLDPTSCPVSERISLAVLCLPLYYELEEEQVTRIAAIVNKSCRR